MVLYQDIINDVHHGQSYYAAAVREQRAAEFPLRPFLAVRLPTEAIAMASLPNDAIRNLALGLVALAAFASWQWRFAAFWEGPISRFLAVLVFGSSMAPAFIAGAFAMHEVWAGFLIALSLALRESRRWGLSLVIGLLAVSIRELAVLYLIVMAAMAWRDGDRAETAAWSVGIAVFVIGLVLHAAAIRPLLHPADLASPGWLALGGWSFLLSMLRWNIVLGGIPIWVTAILAPLALLGLLSRAGPLRDRLTLMVFTYCAACLIVGRPENSYWGLVIAPLWPIGLVDAWPALRTLLARSFIARDRAT